jgi:hypothetical protein
MALRPARLLPPKRLSTPRSARRLSTTNRGLLPGSPAITQAGLTPAGLVQLSGRTMPPVYSPARGLAPDKPPGRPWLGSTPGPVRPGASWPGRSRRWWALPGTPLLPRAPNRRVPSARPRWARPAPNRERPRRSALRGPEGRPTRSGALRCPSHRGRSQADPADLRADLHQPAPTCARPPVMDGIPLRRWPENLDIVGVPASRR